MNFCKRSGVLTFKNKQVFSHSEKTPFIVLHQTLYTFASWRGSLKVKTDTKSSIALENLEIKYLDNKLILHFSNGGNFANLELSINGDILKIKPIDYSSGYNIQFNFSSESNERLFGLGERFQKLNLKGEIIENIVSEHTSLAPILAKAYPFLQKLGLSATANFNDVKTYCPIPIFTSDKLYSIYVDSSSYGIFDFKTLKDVNTITFEQTPQAIYFIVGDSFSDLAKNLHNIIPSRQYLPSWTRTGMILGIKGSLEEATVKALAAKDAGIAVSGIWCENWSGYKKTIAGRQVYWNWEYDKHLYADLEKKVAELANDGIQFLAYVNPYLLKDAPMYNDFKSKGYLILDKKSKVYHIKTTTFKAGMIDLTNPDAFEYTKNIITHNYINIGIKGWMADFGEYLPHDCVLHSGDAYQMHNLWPVLWARCNREAIEESGKKDVFFFSRAGYSGIAEQTSIMWNGDQHTDYTADYGMASVIPATLSLAMSGVPLCHSDIAGFITFGRLVRDKGLWLRWLQMSCFSPLMRSHATPRPLECVQFDYDKEVISQTALYSNIHRLITPYLEHLISNEASCGIPVMRPLFYHYPSEQALYDNDFAYLLGGDMLIAPSFSTDNSLRQLSLPQEDWVCLFTGKNADDCHFTQDKIVVLYKKTSAFCNVFETVTKYINKNNGV